MTRWRFLSWQRGEEEKLCVPTGVINIPPHHHGELGRYEGETSFVVNSLWALTCGAEIKATKDTQLDEKWAKKRFKDNFLKSKFFWTFFNSLNCIYCKSCTLYSSFFLSRNTNELNFVGHLAVGGWVDTSKISRVLLYLPFTTSSPPPLRSHDPHKLGQKIFITSIITIGFPVGYVIWKYINQPVYCKIITSCLPLPNWQTEDWYSHIKQS